MSASGEDAAYTIVVEDPQGYLADWLGQVPVPGARLTVQVTGSWRQRRRLRRELRGLAAGKRNPIFGGQFGRTQDEGSASER